MKPIACGIVMRVNSRCDHVGSAAPIIDAMPVGMIFDSG
jgi:hypothetical protein